MTGRLYTSKIEPQNAFLTASVNKSFFAILSKSGKILIYDTMTGALVVPYNQNGNLFWLASCTNGSLGFVGVNGKFTVIDVYKK